MCLARPTPLQSEPHGEEHLADEGVLGREVVDDHPIAHAESLGQATEGELTQPVLERSLEGPLEDLLARVLGAHGGERRGDYDGRPTIVGGSGG